jgi:hypothetical protein
VHDPATGALLVQPSGLRFAKLDTGAKPDPHTFDRISWKPDVTFLTSDQQLDALAAASAADKVQLVVDLIAHKKPTRKILEVRLDPTDASSLWLNGRDTSSRAAYAGYTFSSSVQSLVAAQTKHGAARDAEFFLLILAKDGLSLPHKSETYDLAIVEFPTNRSWCRLSAAGAEGADWGEGFCTRGPDQPGRCSLGHRVNQRQRQRLRGLGHALNSEEGDPLLPSSSGSVAPGTPAVPSVTQPTTQRSSRTALDNRATLLLLRR